MWDDEDPVLGAFQMDEEGLAGAVDGASIGQGDAGGPALYEVVVGGLAGEVVGATDHGVDSGEVLDDKTSVLDPIGFSIFSQGWELCLL